MDVAFFGVLEVFLMPTYHARKPDRPAAMPAGVYNFCLYTESDAGQETLLVTGRLVSNDMRTSQTVL